MSKKRLITSALPYVNNEPHLGNIIGCVLSADCYARYCRSAGHETLYVCGTDEYGTATETKATQEGMSPREICDKFHAIHAKIYQYFNISFDAFGRTSNPEHTEIVQSIYKEVEESGHLIEKDSEQCYCLKCDKFLADRLVEGKCPKCDSDQARGDQCDSCDTLLTPTELKEPKCSVCASTPEVRSTRHLYLNLPKISDQLERYQEKAIEEGYWPNNAKTTTQSWMKRGLEPRAITRDLKWGVPVPREGYESKVFYVWFDAPIGYISITRRAFPDNWQYWWKDPDNTELYQFMAKDNIPFHSVIFPATQLAATSNWTKVHHLSSTEYLNYEDTRFSKRNNTGVFGTDVINSGIHPDLWRFYLLAVRPERQDTAFSWEDFFTQANKNFINNIGNLVNRALTFCNKFFEGKVPEGEFSNEHSEFISEATGLQTEITGHFEKVSLKEALRLTLKLSQAGNVFFDHSQPWKAIKENPAHAAATISISVHLVRDLAILLQPFMPETSERIFKMLNLEVQTWSALGDFKSLCGRQINNPEVLYQKLDEKLIEKLKEKFCGEKKDDPWSTIELKVGKIIAIENHPTAEHLYVETVDLGEENPRTICSGLVKFCEKDDLLNKHVVVASNLSPAELSGTLSEGMILGVAKKKNFEVIDCQDAIPGTLLLKEDEQAAQKPQGIDIGTFKKAALRVVDGSVCINGEALFAGDKQIKTSLVMNGKIS
jgi:methionyl-tRNA synthetase